MKETVTKKCTKCQIEKDLSQYYFDKTNNRLYARCKKCFSKIIIERNCNSDMYLKYSKSEKGRQKRNEATKRARLKFPEKWEARKLLRLAIRRGEITKEKCRVCESANVQGHHPDYSKPLYVIWLCSKHHTEIHKGNLILK